MTAWTVTPDIRSVPDHCPLLAERCQMDVPLADIGCNVSFRSWRLTPGDPLLPFAPSAVERQVTKYSGRSKRLLDGNSSALAVLRPTRQMCLLSDCDRSLSAYDLSFVASSLGLKGVY